MIKFTVTALLALILAAPQAKAEEPPKRSQVLYAMADVTYNCGIQPAAYVFQAGIFLSFYVAPVWLLQTLLAASIGPDRTIKAFEKMNEKFDGAKDVQSIVLKLIEADKRISTEMKQECKAAAKRLYEVLPKPKPQPIPEFGRY